MLWIPSITNLISSTVLLLYVYMWQRYCFVFVLCFLPLISGAQFGIGDIQSQQSSIVLNPAFPNPGDTVTATVNGGSNVFGSQLTWTYNDEQVEGTDNQRSIEITAGGAGTNSTLSVTVTNPSGQEQVISALIKPLYLDLIIEPQTRVPNWYLGRALPSYASQINATALLHDGTSFLNPSTVVYTWEIDKNPIESGAIRGGNKVSFETPRGKGPVLVVTAADTQGITIASRAVLLNTVTPEMLYYEKHSLYGVSTQSIGSAAAVIGNVLTLQAEPYYLDTRVYNRPDIAQWEINSIETSNGVGNPYEITLSRSGVGGRTLVNFHVRSLQEVLQGTESQITVNF